MSNYIQTNGYQVATCLYEFIDQHVLPQTGLNNEAFWSGFAQLLTDLVSKNQNLLAERERMQQQINEYHLAAKGAPLDLAAYQQFLTDIGYIVPEPADFSIDVAGVDPEVATIAGPQLVVPLMNARYALNAANARWGSLYDALYGTDVIGAQDGAGIGAGYNPVRGKKVIAYGRDFLDSVIPLAGASHHQVNCYQVVDGELKAYVDKQSHGLQEPTKLVGYVGDPLQPQELICNNNDLHFAIQMDKNDQIGIDDLAHVKDIVMESAVTTIMDCEDSIAAVDGEDKTLVYQNWLGLIKGDLTEKVEKNGRSFVRQLNGDRQYTDLNGNSASLSGRSLLFIRNVGHLMTNNAVLDQADQEMPEGLLDAVFTSLISMLDIQNKGQYNNSHCGSIYIVKPKMHGPAEVAFSCELFDRVEQLLQLPKNTIKMGIMDEERRTSVNLKACIHVAKSRVVFINTGFLDRTGDEIHTSMFAGPVVTKESMKDEAWIGAYEARNVAIGLQTGLKGKAQIGKGMWAMPDFMAQMMRDKMGHLQAGANCAWVPSPTAATLHAMHYHQLSVEQVQNQLLQQLKIPSLSQLLTVPLLAEPDSLSAEQIQAELDNNIQGLLGYVVRWVDQGIGCSKVPDLNDIGRMEDRATLRISSQHICNWWHHGILTEQQIMDSLRKMARVVDHQNVTDDLYIKMAEDFEHNIAFNAAKDLIFKGKEQPSGYTEPLLHQARAQVKSRV